MTSRSRASTTTTTTPSSPSGRTAGAGGQQQQDSDKKSTTSSITSCVPVFIENTRELFSFPIEDGVRTKMSHLRDALAQKMSVHPNTLTFKILRQRAALDTKLCTIPENTVVQVSCDDEKYQSQAYGVDANNTSYGSSLATTPMSTGRTTSRSMYNGGDGGGDPRDVHNHSRNVSIYESATAPLMVKHVDRLPKLDLTKNYAGRQANIDLSSTSARQQQDNNTTSPFSRQHQQSNGEDFDETRYYVKSPTSTGRGGISLLSSSSNQSRTTATNPTSPNIALRKPESKKPIDVKILVSLENGDPTTVTVELEATVEDLRLRCNVSADEYPTVCCEDRRIMFEQRTFKELAIAENDRIVFSTKTPEDWGDSEPTAALGASRLTRMSGGKMMALDVSSGQIARGVGSPSRSSMNTTSYNYNNKSGMMNMNDSYNNNNNTNTANYNSSQQRSHQQITSNVASFLNHRSQHQHQQQHQVDPLNQSTRSESSAYGQPVLSPDRNKVGSSPPSSRATSQVGVAQQQQSQYHHHQRVEPLSPSYLSAPHVSPVTVLPRGQQQQPNQSYQQQQQQTNNIHDVSTTSTQRPPNINNMSYEAQISYYNNHEVDNKTFRAQDGQPIIVHPLSPSRIGTAQTHKNFSLVNVNNSARSQALYKPGSLEDSRVQDANTDCSGQSPSRGFRSGSVLTVTTPGGHGTSFMMNQQHNTSSTSNNNSTNKTMMMTPAQRNAALRAKLVSRNSSSTTAQPGFSSSASALASSPVRSSNNNNKISFVHADDPTRELPDSPSRKSWISQPSHPHVVSSAQYQHAVEYGCYLDIHFEDPTDDNFTHELRVWSLNPCAFLYSFAGDASEDRYHLLCDGNIILYPSASFGSITKGRDGCLFSFARKQ